VPGREFALTISNPSRHRITRTLGRTPIAVLPGFFGWQTQNPGGVFLQFAMKLFEQFGRQGKP
jgi:hypothetical protein